MVFSIVRLLLLVRVFLFAETVSLTYILKRENAHVRPSCIAENAERYSAVGWIYPVPTEDLGLPNTTTKFIPSIQSDYNCKFSKNEKCNVLWSGRDWQIDEKSSSTREFINDNRWEDLPTVLISNSSTDFERRFHLEDANKVGFSVRAVGIVEIFLCTGWNPRNYPCYYFQIDKQDIYFNKLNTWLPDDDYKVTQLEYSKTASNIVAEDEWRSFEVSIEEKNITLIDKNNNDRLLISHVDEQPLKPLYLMMRSSEPSLWKVIENYFMYTETTQISRMGPQFQTSYKDLCVSLFVATCSYCQITFFYMNGTTRHDLKYIAPTDYNWVEVKLKQENIRLAQFNLFVETSFLNKPEDETKGWWAYDDIRVCNENEVKVTYLKVNQTYAEDDSTVSSIFSCQLIRQPSFRPESMEYDQIEDFPPVKITANDTSIMLKWAEEDPDHYLTYFVYYQGNDICSTDIGSSRRLKSGGFLTTKHDEIVIPKLIPYTLYNITLSSVLHEKDRVLRTSTLESDEPKLEELPIKMHIRPLDTAVNISWDKPNCNSRYGRLIYKITVSNEKLHFKKELEMSTENSFLIAGLRPYTKHNLTVVTARNTRSFIKGVHTQSLTYEFTTLPGDAPPVRNLELYAIGPKKASLRYDLPSNTQGEPTDVQVIKCNVLSRAKCKALISSISRCTLWPRKMCVDVDYLMPDQNFTFKVSIKNAYTNAFGEEIEIAAQAVERVPAPPENVTYEVVDCQESIDYCNLNISWLHPSNPNGTINVFNIILNSTYFNTSYSEEDQTMHEIYKVINDTYLPKYTYQVKYVPYSKEYNLYIQSENSKYKSEFATTTVKTADLGDHIDQSPKLLGKGDKAVVFKLPPLDRRLDSYTLTIGVQDYNESVPVHLDAIENQKVADNICHPFGVTWISQVLKVKDNQTKTVTISGLDDEKLIKPETKYCIIFIITNKYRGEDHDVVYYEKLTTPSSAPPPSKDAPKSGSNHLYMLFLLLLLVPIGFAVFWYTRRRRNLKKPEQTIENEYESLPFEEHERNVVNNRTYDQLIHK